MSINPEKIYELLQEVRRPARYMGKELNSVQKSPDKFRVALSYPDVYDIGMGNLALQILYEVLNGEEDIWAERVFAPWFDMEEKLKEKNLPLYTLESYTPVGEMDLLGITLPYELVYTNILTILDCSGITLMAEERGENETFVIGGGPAVANPEPIAPFFDAFIIGDGEKSILDVSRAIQKGRAEGQSRKDILKTLSAIPGVYVPSLVPVSYDESGFYLTELPEKSVCKRVEPDLNTLLAPVKSPVPWGKVFHDKGTLELFRGCYHRCRFCQAGAFYKPVRERNPKAIQETVRGIFENQGLREFSLMSLSTGDYSQLPELLKRLNKEWAAQRVSFFLPSLKIDSFNLDLLDELKLVRKSGLTLAVEAGNDSIRSQINKNVSDERLFEIVNEAAKRGWRQMKLYFMVGMTSDIKAEAAAIEELLHKVSGMNKQVSYNVSVNLFIPKTLTPFQWQKMYPIEEANQIFYELRQAFKKNKRVKIKSQKPNMVYLEGILARGSRKLAPVILKAYQLGCRFDGWEEAFQLELWLQALNAEKANFNYEIFKEDLDKNKILPWDFLDIRVSREFLEKEAEKAKKAERSESCDHGCKDFCGACDSEVSNKKAEAVFSDVAPQEALFKTSQDFAATAGLVFECLGALKFLSQLDFMAWWEKLLIKAKIPLLFSEGFNPRPRLEFGFGSMVGMESEYENIRFQMWQKLELDEVIQRIEEASNGLIKIQKGQIFEKRPKSLQSISFYQDIELKKVFVKDKNLLTIINERYKVLEDTEKTVIFRIPLAEKLRVWEELCDVLSLKRLKCLTKEEDEVL